MGYNFRAQELASFPSKTFMREKGNVQAQSVGKETVSFTDKAKQPQLNPRSAASFPKLSVKYPVETSLKPLTCLQILPHFIRVGSMSLNALSGHTDLSVRLSGLEPGLKCGTN